MKIVFGFIVLLSSHLVLANTNSAYTPVSQMSDHGEESSCPTIDLRSRLGAIRNQQDLRWCYGYTAADLVTYQLQKNNQQMFIPDAGIDQQVSAFQMVAEYQSGRAGQSLVSSQRTGGFTADTLQQVFSSARICTEAQIRSVGGSRSAFLQSLKDMAKQRFSGVEIEPGKKSAELARINTEREVVEEELNRICTTPLHDLLKVDSLRDNNRTSPKDPSSIPKQEFGDKIRRALAEGDIIGVDYFASFLVANGSDASADHSRHASSIVGQRFMNGKCHYMLRNSWGPNCNLYVEPYKSQCRNGVIYVEEEQFLSTVYGTSRVQAQNSHDIEANTIIHIDPSIQISH